ncbi:uncharacterized protein LOC129945045 [Eupeodes corollae]|uniref:uncharacterized protein LOC129945045 n=1 Tax=Eupeodes corollae TaxID=290404 RepID=UPI002493041E|nr:uncharacterized protein LOC129945045 [Eupeodes corollae]
MAEVKLEKLRVKRQVIIGQLGRTKEFLKRASAALTAELETRLESLESTRTNFEAIQLKIEELDENEVTLPIRGDFEETYFEIRPALLNLISDARHPSDSEPTNRTVLDTTIGGTPIRLPEIPLPKFSGDYVNWTSFYQTFVTLIHNNPALNNITRFHFLRSALSERALSSIRALEVNEPNYEVALKTLVSRYNKENSATELRTLLDELNVHLSALTSLGRPTVYWDDPMIYLMCTKLDSLSLDKWNDIRSQDRFPTLDEFKKFLENRAFNLDEKSCLAPAAYTSNLKNIKPKKDNKQPQTSLIAVHEKLCSYCSGTKHNIYRCRKFLQLSPEQRYNSANGLKLCINCLKTGHLTDSCSLDKCRTCKQPHHTLLHDHLKASSASSASSAQPETPSKEP